MAMENFVFNIAKGRVAEFAHRVDAGDPSTSRIILVPLAVGDTAANARAFDDLAAVLAGTMDEAGGSWGRKVLTATDVSDIVVDDTGNLMPASIPNVTWTAPTVGQNVVGLLVCYIPVSTGADSTVIPMTAHIMAVTADGNNVVLNSGQYFQAT